MTDCFQPIERELGVTLEAIRAMNERGIGYLIVTKSDLVAEPEYLEALDPGLAHVQVSITSTDDDVLSRNENAPSFDRRRRAVETLQENGIDVALRLSPYVPEWVDVSKLNEVECDKVLVEFLRCNSWIRKWLDIDWSPYTLRHGGYWHLSLDRKIELLGNIDFPQVSVCDDVPEHYEWFKENLNCNPDDCCNLRA